MHAPDSTQQPDRRGFFKRAFATVIGIVIGLVPIASGLTVFFDPLRRKSSTSGAIRVTTLEALPIDGVPRKFPVVASRVDAWNTFTEVPIGAVYLRRTGERTLQAFNVVCPHAGCFVDFLPERGSFRCPCHESTFTADGKIDNPDSPAQRGLDSLKVEIRGNKEVWVEFQNFQAGHAEKLPIA
ncbi:MAG: Rieske (2Fe-2S) protein [Verrucomicrobia bacterium]|nr:Rieske (2Fe-2S) protein [Verrucomicrobiota bacterium]